MTTAELATLRAQALRIELQAPSQPRRARQLAARRDREVSRVRRGAPGCSCGASKGEPTFGWVCPACKARQLLARTHRALPRQERVEWPMSPQLAAIVRRMREQGIPVEVYRTVAGGES